MQKSALSRFIRLALLAFIFLLAGMGTFAKRGWLDWKRIAQRNQDLQQEIAEINRSKQSLERRTEALQSSPAEQERVVRQVLGYVRPQETVIEFP